VSESRVSFPFTTCVLLALPLAATSSGEAVPSVGVPVSEE